MESGPQICAQKKKPEFFLVVLVVGLSFLERFNRAGFFGTDVKKLKDSGDVPGLISALIQNDPQVQYDAAEALGELGDKRAVGPLITELKNNELSGVRWKAAEALSRIGAASVDELIGVLQHEDDDVRWKAAIALGEIGDPKAIGPLIRLLCDNDRFVKSRAAYALGMIGEQAVDPLIRALREGDGNLRGGAAIALGKIRDTRSIEPLICALADKYENVRIESATSLAAIGKPALEPLLHFLQMRERSTRFEIVTALGNLKDPGAIQPLLRIFENADNDNDDERTSVSDALNTILIPVAKTITRVFKDENTQKNEKSGSDTDEGEEYHG